MADPWLSHSVCPNYVQQVLKVTGCSCVRRAECIANVYLIFLPKISSAKSVSNLILVVEVRCHKVQGMMEPFYGYAV